MAVDIKIQWGRVSRQHGGFTLTRHRHSLVPSNDATAAALRSYVT